ncbi:glycosyltransferase family 2 protein [Helicobacter brantae]|uniref:Glycosyltransferase 2-like domain-containing protein n=1 Tax=Helicobacter brantae TaxID=375927 RepID=A0A3D8J1R3_9HELI|nr:glycosyltransferase family A protein [Helicobacter brantae]RDU71479.1 hypothetical protein CQA58_02740 [Helicobacter brantae]
MNPPLLSVILPTYNRDYCVGRMIDSVLAQNFKDFELIIIDDGSSDETPRVLQRYDDRRIVVLTQSNQGVSSARNLGLSQARGEYITFVDSDDYLLQGFFEDIAGWLSKEKSDILVYEGEFVENFTKKTAPIFWERKEYCPKEAVKGGEFLEEFCLYGGNSWACAKVFRRGFLQKYSLSFDEKISYGEDMLLLLQCYELAQSIRAIQKHYYVCDRRDEASLSQKQTLHIKKVDDLFQAYYQLKKSTHHISCIALNYIKHSRQWLAKQPLSYQNKIDICSLHSDWRGEREGVMEEIESWLISKHRWGLLRVFYILFPKLCWGIGAYYFLYPKTIGLTRRIAKKLLSPFWSRGSLNKK